MFLSTLTEWCALLKHPGLSELEPGNGGKLAYITQTMYQRVTALGTMKYESTTGNSKNRNIHLHNPFQLPQTTSQLEANTPENHAIFPNPNFSRVSMRFAICHEAMRILPRLQRRAGFEK
ncbi:hypothetical protein I7I51_05289 [Histoplasma capsulatum]|uniref:Uncharacterized protein n=1 Tax=Ajellomyces capsulatus TaxID=5037 RepID=A0A8A1M346_AJECA|nr:hypothetical protein I7I51_05289 [Histoplasma capsulatum]